ncbi:MAG: DUF5908 family protein [Methylotenera sp.]
MPIEIKELHIKVTVNTPPSEAPSGGAPNTPSEGSGDVNAIVAECVEQVLDILKHKSER